MIAIPYHPPRTVTVRPPTVLDRKLDLGFACSVAQRQRQEQFLLEQSIDGPAT